MCGRYQFSVGRSEDLLRIARDVQRRSGEGAQLPLPDGDVRPAQRAPVLVSRGGKVVGELQTWGLPGPSGRLIINARAETVTQKSLFRRSIAARRCVVPATAFYERDARPPGVHLLPTRQPALAGRHLRQCGRRGPVRHPDHRAQRLGQPHPRPDALDAGAQRHPPLAHRPGGGAGAAGRHSPAFATAGTGRAVGDGGVFE